MVVRDASSPPVDSRLVAGLAFRFILLSMRVAIISVVGAYYALFFVEDALKKRGAR